MYDMFGFSPIDSFVPCPLFENEELIQQPADLLKITATYMNAATSFIKTKAGELDEKNSHIKLEYHFIMQPPTTPFSSMWHFSTPTSLSLLGKISPTPPFVVHLAMPWLS